MLTVSLNSKNFQKTMNNILEYSYGFLEGANKGKRVFLDNIGKSTIEVLKRYIDIEARANPNALHHVYEWYQIGSPSARLFDITYSVNNSGLVLSSSFKQSRSLSKDSTVPFYNKAKIMEGGVRVTISPKNGVLVFQDGGKTIFTRRPVDILNPGGDAVAGSFERTFDDFISKYFKQSFLKASGIYDYIKKPVLYKENMPQGAKAGRSKGVSTGYKWIANAKVEVE